MSSYYYDSDDDYYDHYSYDAAEHMTNDPVHFQMYGYGGFGYDTSHIGPDEPMSDMCINASRGDLSGVMNIVERADSISDEEKVKVINYARKWTEVDYRMSGFTKEWTWFDLTPVAAAATLGHHEVVEYLLQQGADPTLTGCPTENVTVNALQAAKKNLDYESRQGNNNGEKCNNAKRCVDLLSVANLFWDKASYSSSRFSTKARAVFSNRPNNYQLLQEALNNYVPDISDYPEKQLREDDLERIKEVTNPKARVARVGQQISTRKSGVPFGDNYDDYDDDYNVDNYGLEEVVYFRPDGDTESKDIQWCKDKGFFEVEEGLWSGEWYNKTELICNRCNESKHTSRFTKMERMIQEHGLSPRCKVCNREEPSGLSFWDNDNDDDDDEDNHDFEEVIFFRPDGDTETKDRQWCLDNGFFEVEAGLWWGEWYYETDLEKRRSLRTPVSAAQLSVHDKPPTDDNIDRVNHKTNVDTLFKLKQADDDKKSIKPPFSFGEATDTPSFSIGSNEKKNRKNKNFKFTDRQDTTHVSTPKSAGTFSLGGADRKQSTSIFCFGGIMPQNTVASPSSSFAESPKAVPNSDPLQFGSNNKSLR
ncbi:hypothetical protein ACHAXM_001984 [Skeletonema potamos]|jgi:hypothetical protein